MESKKFQLPTPKQLNERIRLAVAHEASEKKRIKSQIIPIKEAILPVYIKKLEANFDPDKPNDAVRFSINTKDIENYKDILLDNNYKPHQKILIDELKKDITQSKWEADIKPAKNRFGAYFKFSIKPIINKEKAK